MNKPVPPVWAEVFLFLFSQFISPSFEMGLANRILLRKF